MEFVFGAFSYTLWNKSNWKQKCIEPTRNLVMAMAKSAVEAQGKRGRGNFLCGLAGLSSPSLVGRLYSVDWTQDWTVELDWGTGLTESCAHPIRSSTHTTTLQYAYITWTEFRADGHHPISISIGPDEVLAAISGIAAISWDDHQ